MEKKFKEIVAKYCTVKPEEMNSETRFRENLGLNSLDFMSMLGEFEDTFDVELEEEDVQKIWTVGQALELLEKEC